MPRYLPFDEFIQAMKSVKPASPTTAGYALDTVPEFTGTPAGHGELAKMQQFVLDYYNGGQIRVPKTYLRPDGEHVDCIPYDQQPSLRGLTAAEIDKRLDPPGYDGPAFKASAPATNAGAAPIAAASQAGHNTADQVGNTRTVPDGHVPVPRLTMDRMTQFASFKDFFRKPPWRSPDEIRQRNQGAITAPMAAGIEPRYHSHASQIGQAGVDIFTGAGSWMNVWTPSPGRADFSLSQLWIVHAPAGPAQQTIEGGWIVSPQRYPSSGGRPVLFIFMTFDSYGEEASGWNGYIGNMNIPQGGSEVTTQSYFSINPQQTFKWSIGQPIDPQSSPGGQQLGFRMQWQRHPQTMDWWLFLGGGDQGDMEPIGMIRSEFFQNGPLVQPNLAANVVDFGGEEQNNSATSAAPIGSGRFSSEGYQHAAFHKLITAQTTGGTVPAAIDPQTFRDSPASFYTIQVGQADPNWGTYLFFGGPGSGT